jgi:hypothetical protein
MWNIRLYNLTAAGISIKQTEYQIAMAAKVNS